MPTSLSCASAVVGGGTVARPTLMASISTLGSHLATSNTHLLQRSLGSRACCCYWIIAHGAHARGTCIVHTWVCRQLCCNISRSTILSRWAVLHVMRLHLLRIHLSMHLSYFVVGSICCRAICWFVAHLLLRHCVWYGLD